MDTTVQRTPGWINFFRRRLVCRLFGHVKADMSIATVGVRVCTRCLRITDQKTVRARVTRGEIVQRMKEHPPKGYSFVNCNWKKRKAKFVSTSGALKTVLF
jgi:hypothetical protein